MILSGILARNLAGRGEAMTIEEKLIKNTLGLMKLAVYLKNMSEVCLMKGYRWYPVSGRRRVCVL